MVCIKEVAKLLRKRLTSGGQPTDIIQQKEQHRQLLGLLARTAEGGESNSILVIGPRGSGKTTLVENVLSELHKTVDAESHLLQVRLNGLMQTDDRLALKEITRQLGLENVVGDKVFGSFAENLQFLLDALKSGNHQSKSILFLLEEFDLFTYHRNQTLLYNLFDVSQSEQTPICVLGITARLDILELLEKRVKSRFSHRQIYMLPQYSLEEYSDILFGYLSLSNEDNQDWQDKGQPITKSFIKQWNTHLEVILEDLSIRDILNRMHSVSRDVRQLQMLAMIPVCRLSQDHPLLLVSDFVDSAAQLFTDSKAEMLHGVSILELCLIIAMMHLIKTYDGEPFNFQMVYNEYQKYCIKRSSIQMSDRAVVLKAFQHLQALELVRPLDGSSSRIQEEYRLLHLYVTHSQITEALQKYPSCPTDIKAWAQQAVITH